jgi:predicted TIM-barrel fold metal-dependent hydrolase
MSLVAEQRETRSEAAESEKTRFRLISGDSHVNEPPDLWTSRAPSKYLDRVPRIVSFDEGDAWVIEGVDDPINFGLNACAGMPPEAQTGWIRFPDLRRGGWDPGERLREMDQDGVDLELLYPTPRVSQGVVTNQDGDLQIVMIRAYNDWLSTYCGYKPSRLAGLAMLPTCGVDDAVTEYERAIQLPGIKGAVMSCYPHGTTAIDPDDDRLFAAVVASGLPLNIHVGLSIQPPTMNKSKLPGDVRFYDAPQRILEFLWSGVFDRFPSLKLGFIEVDCGWVGYLKEQLDNRYNRMAAANRLEMGGPPSTYIDRHCFFTYITDTFGIDNRHAIGLENILWSSDYPHVGADWPNSWRTIDASFSGVPKAERELILWRNAARLYQLS